MNNSTNDYRDWNTSNPSCIYLTRFLVYPVQPLKISYIVNCVLNAILSVTAGVGNALVIWALRKSCSALRAPSRALLLSLALSDFSVGVFVQPLYVTYKAAEIYGNLKLFCVSGMLFHLSANVFSAVSFLTVTAISIDRFLALYLRNTYSGTVTLKRTGILLAILWSSTSLWIMTWLKDIRIYQVFNITAVCTCLFISATAYITLQIRLRELQGQIESRLEMRELHGGGRQTVRVGTPHLEFYRRSVNTMFCIYVLLLLCYVPYLFMFILIQVTGRNATKIAAISFSVTVMFVNASLNPFLYCLRIREIRKEILVTISKLLRR